MQKGGCCQKLRQTALFELEKRGITCGVDVAIFDEMELHNIDPSVKTFKHALYSLTTATVNPVMVCRAIKQGLIQKGVEFRFNEAFAEIFDGNEIAILKESLSIIFSS